MAQVKGEGYPLVWASASRFTGRNEPELAPNQPLADGVGPQLGTQVGIQVGIQIKA